MPAEDRILLVEGNTDKIFFEALLRLLDLQGEVLVAPPRHLSARAYNSKQGVFNYLKTVLLQQLEDGSISRLALVVDADSPPDGGFQRTLDSVASIVAPAGYSPCPEGPGYRFRHNDGLSDLGLWIMPDNQNTGMLEDWAKSCLAPSERTLFEHARDATCRIPEQRFSALHQSKAEIAAWLAWQKNPGRSLDDAVTNGRIDSQSPLFLELTGWISSVFSA